MFLQLPELRSKMTNKRLIKFIREARTKGYDDYQIKEPLLRKGWPIEMIEEAFVSLKPRPKFKNKITIYLDSEVLEAIDKRARKNIFTIPEQIEDILRRSVINGKKNIAKMEKLDDSLVAIFSRNTKGKKRK